jgi:hypothetical protein
MDRSKSRSRLLPPPNLTFSLATRALQNAVEDVWDLAEVLITILTFKTGLTALWSTAQNRNTKIGAAVIIIIFLMCMVIGMLILLPADATEGRSWTPFRDACNPHPCGSYGRCMDLPGVEGGKELEYQCLCDNGWAGETCQIALACASSPCQAGGGVCEDQSDGSFVCVCNPGYTGELCDQIGIGEPCESLQLANGQADGQCTGSGTAGGSCFLSCLVPYLLFSEGVLASSLTRTCQSDGLWTGTMPVCERPDCGGTVSVMYSIQGSSFAQMAPCSGDDTRYGGDSCAISCNTGFFMSSGSATLTCGTDGTWTGSPVCTECTAIARCSGDVTCATDSDQQCSQCEAGYTANAQCGIIDCGPTIPGLDSQASATCTGNTQYGGDDCTAVCDEGWQSAAGVHQGTAVFSCSASTAAWAGSLVCSAMSCGALTLAHGSMTGQCEGDAVGDSCTVLGCDAGYFPSDSGVVNTARECQADGSWTGATAVCVGIPCSLNTVVPHSDRSASNPCVTGTGSACDFACDAGFRSQGVHACNADGTLSGGSCERNACTAGLTLPNSPTTCSGVFEDVCAYECAVGMTATTQHVCGADGSFSGGLCTPCSDDLQDLLDWLETDSATFSYCPTHDTTTYQGMLTVDYGKELFVDGSGGTGGTISFNGLFQRKYGGRAAAVTLTDAQLTASTGVWAVGDNQGGKLGLGDTTSRESLEQVTALGSGVVQLAASQAVSAALTADGEVYLWGNNGNGQVGDGTTTNRLVPTRITALGTDTVQLALGRDHALALTQGGAVYSWGKGDGRLGLGDTDNRLSPTEVASLGSDNAYIAAQRLGGMALKSDGQLFNWGDNLGDGTTTRRNSPVQLAAVGSDNAHVVGGDGHTLLLKADGSVETWGQNNAGQVGNGATTSQVRFRLRTDLT